MTFTARDAREMATRGQKLSQEELRFAEVAYYYEDCVLRRVRQAAQKGMMSACGTVGFYRIGDDFSEEDYAHAWLKTMANLQSIGYTIVTYSVGKSEIYFEIDWSR